DVHVKTSDGASSGVHLNIKAGEVLVNEPGVMRKGTEMEVNHLFFNTPARLKHIKSLNTELSHITDYLNKIALSHPEIAFKLLNNQRLLFQTNGQNNLQSVIASVYGFDVAKKMIPFSAKNDDFEISGFLSDPIINRASRNYVTIIVNGRAIRNYNLMRSIIEAYHTLLPKDKYPIVVLNLKLDPILVDVNVHPAKLEVRFSQEESLKTFIYHELRNVLKQVEYIPETQIEEPKVVMPKPIQQTLSLTKEATFKPTIAVQMVDENPIELKKESVDVKKESVHVEEVAEPMVSLEQPAQDFKVVVPTRQAIPQLELHYIGQLHGTYLLAQNEEGLFIVDQHAAMERIQYEKNYALLKDVKGDCIELIIPMVLKYSANELLLLKESLPSLMKFGFEIEEFGGQSLVVRTIPVWVQNLDAKLIVETILQQIIYDNKVDIGKLRESVAIMMSCKGSIKANQYINEHEIKQMLVDLCLCDQPYTCPHGRPIIVKLTKYEIEKLFKRVM
ncbi:DNA mismatch repair protein MutL, partial [Turicibacter sanguinis]|nr:DNA mismatch repair protein MutL [Turicibacter sanguinis]